MGGICCKPQVIDFDGPVDLWHFSLLRAVGKGAFGKERRLLEEIDCPYVVNLRYAFQDDENLFMVIDLMLGGDLRFHLERNGAFDEQTVKIYVAEIALALDYLHKRRIVHRDVKPDNILLDEQGHAHLTDFNIACFLGKRALTGVAGSMAYMAPEVLEKRGYFTTVDWWSLGIVAFELLFNKRPFRARTNSSLTNAITKQELIFPDNAYDLVSKDGISAINGLLTRDPDLRLGCSEYGGFEELMKHPWFSNLDWDALSKKQLPPTFVPDSKKANFDATHELEELLLEDNPLKAKKRDPKRDISTLEPVFVKMEEKFGVYDYTRMRRKSYFRANEATKKTIKGARKGVEKKPEGKFEDQDEININEYNSDSSSDSDGSSDDEAISKEAKSVPKAPTNAQVKAKLEKAKAKKNQRGVVYVGRIPHGFYEDQMKAYFSQFGEITRLRLSRNKKTGKSKHYAFIEFENLQVAEIVAETMNNYLIDNRLLVVEVVDEKDINEHLFKGANRKFRAVPTDRIERISFNKEKTEEEKEKSKKRYQDKLAKKQEKLNNAGIDYQIPM
ncbi:kinase-like protein [Wallemia mellicola]|nr:kinase-like protein [Wallemia mellicola]TIC58386.1 kinase-like protein [Wallemia mellicola]TIC74787.1 kinase-like protein [Wallemia mellicola]